MTREEQITDTAWHDEYVNNGYDCTVFCRGAQWADEHPSWHDLRKNPNDLPIENPDKRYWVFDGESYHSAEYNNGYWLEDRYGIDETENVIAWFELPSFTINKSY